MSRTSFSGPLTGNYVTVSLHMDANGDQAHFDAPGDGFIVEISRYAQTSTAGTLEVDNETSGDAWLNAGAMTADTVHVTAADTIGGDQAFTKGDEISATAGGTCTNVTCILTLYLTTHVAESRDNDK
jgi:uncharacterized protein (AIM24 family)